MRLSKQQSVIMQLYSESAIRHFLKNYKLDCSIAATRVACETLAKYHFKVKPLSVQVEAYNDKFLQKMKEIKESGQEEAQHDYHAWAEEGALAALVPNHLVAIVNDMTMVDLSISQSSHDERLKINPIVCDVYDEFLSGEKTLLIDNSGVTMVYHAYPDDKFYLSVKDWFDKEYTKPVVKEISGEIGQLQRLICKTLKTNKINSRSKRKAALEAAKAKAEETQTA